ncbi:MAG TPA: hypothetical protein PKD86_16610 [Gemmatales bacterium]|nr:hypothetical protein [Gemmatales bacterium]HMP60967.1 hypothetical protein [Gemmatales bacterium]
MTNLQRGWLLAGWMVGLAALSLLSAGCQRATPGPPMATEGFVSPMEQVKER